jgi:IS5 family transposase
MQQMRLAAGRQRSFADLEFIAQAVLDPVLECLSSFLERHGELVELVHRDLTRGLKRPKSGRRGLGAQQVLLAFVLQRVKDWDLRELRDRIADGITLRQFTGFWSDRVPRHQAFHRAFSQLTPDTLWAVNQAVVRAAVDLGVEDGKTLRADTTVVETNIHWPTDSELLWDSVRVLTRLSRAVLAEVPALPERFSNRTRAARRRMQAIHRMSRAQRGAELRPTYRSLLKIARGVVENARGVHRAAKNVSADLDPMVGLRVDGLLWEIEHYAALADHVIDQARRRVLENETLAADKKIYSIFEPHTDLIKRGKANRPVEFGHKVFLAESRQGLITDYRVLHGNPPDQQRVGESVEHHRQMFGIVPSLYAADRGFYSIHNVEGLAAAGVKLESVPQRGGHKTPERIAHEKSRAFKRAQRFRAGIEGRISVLFRGRGMRRCRLRGRARFELFVGAAVLANNLLIIASHLRGVRSQRAAA